MFNEKKRPAQCELWIAAEKVVSPTQSGFYTKLEETLESFGFAEKVRALCAPAYDRSGVGRPGIDPVVYLKMIMVGFFEDLPSERAIAARCADSMSIRAFLKYELHEKTPEHSSFTVIRQRLGLEVYQRIFTLTLQALREHGLLRGRNLGIDASVSVTSDKGYYAVNQLQALQGEGIRAIIADPIDNRRVDKLDAQGKRAVRAALGTVKSQSGKELLRCRGMHIERSFAHILDCGGMRRTTLRGWENLNKRYKLAAAFYNLSQLMRKLFGFGTPKQLAALGRGLFVQLACFWAFLLLTLGRNCCPGLSGLMPCPGILLESRN